MGLEIGTARLFNDNDNLMQRITTLEKNFQDELRRVKLGIEEIKKGKKTETREDIQLNPPESRKEQLSYLEEEFLKHIEEDEKTFDTMINMLQEEKARDAKLKEMLRKEVI